MWAIAAGCILIWAMAIRWKAAFSYRLPVRFSRSRSVLPDETGNGAIPGVHG